MKVFQGKHWALAVHWPEWVNEIAHFEIGLATSDGPNGIDVAASLVVFGFGLSVRRD